MPGYCLRVFPQFSCVSGSFSFPSLSSLHRAVDKGPMFFFLGHPAPGKPIAQSCDGVLQLLGGWLALNRNMTSNQTFNVSTPRLHFVEHLIKRTCGHFFFNFSPRFFSVNCRQKAILHFGLCIHLAIPGGHFPQPTTHLFFLEIPSHGPPS